jgi:hypothetical protein
LKTVVAAVKLVVGRHSLRFSTAAPTINLRQERQATTEKKKVKDRRWQQTTGKAKVEENKYAQPWRASRFLRGGRGA